MNLDQFMTTEQKFELLVFIQEWRAELVARLNNVCVEKQLSSEQKLEFAQRIAESENLSVLRDGDSNLDSIVAMIDRHHLKCDFRNLRYLKAKQG